MVDGRQRFCPLCDRVFVAGEAVLRCGNCGVMHHPACWVKNSGCSQECEGEKAPEPVAYEVLGARAPEPHPAEGTRVTRSAMPPPVRGAETPRDPIERVTPPSAESATPSQPADEPRTEQTPAAPPPGRARPNVGAVRPAPPVVIEPPRRAQRGRYESADRSAPSVEDLDLYGRRGILRYWYVPVAAIVAVLVAVGIIWGADQFMGGTSDVPADSDETETTPTPSDDDQPAPTPAGPTPAATAPAGGEDDAAEPTEPGGPIQTQLEQGATAVVTGTDACLNIRVAPGTENSEIACVADGVEVTIVDGPQDAGDFTWWQVETPQGTGWAAGAFLRRVN